MSNAENIKPYADFAHEAAQHGGVDSYLNELETASYDQGSSDTLGKVFKYAPVVIGGAILVWEGGKRLVKRGVDYFSNRQENNAHRIENAKTAIKAGVTAAEEGNQDNDTVDGEEV